MTRLSTVLVFLAVFFCGCSNEPEHWQEAQKENSDESYDVYLQTFPKGPHATEARQRREQLMEQQDWATAVEDNQIESIGNYIQNHPKGAHLIQARELLRSVRDEVAWKSALQSDSVPGYQKYISGGWLIHAATARDSLMNLVEKCDWMTASEDGTIDAYRAYLANHRDGPNSQAALVCIEELRHDNSWEAAESKNTIAAYTDMLTEFPQTCYRTEITEKISELRIEEAWAVAKEENTIDAYQRFLSSYNNSRYQDEAIRLIFELHASCDFDEARALGTPFALKCFLNAHGDSSHASEAKRLLEEAQAYESIEKPIEAAARGLLETLFTNVHTQHPETTWEATEDYPLHLQFSVRVGEPGHIQGTWSGFTIEGELSVWAKYEGLIDIHVVHIKSGGIEVSGSFKIAGKKLCLTSGGISTKSTFRAAQIDEGTECVFDGNKYVLKDGKWRKSE